MEEKEERKLPEYEKEETDRQPEDKRIIILSREKPVKAVVKLGVPLIAGMFIMVLYNLVDTYFIGLMRDDYQLAAVNLAYPVMMISIAISNMVGAGASSLIARSLGADDREKADHTLTVSFLLTIINSMIVMTSGLLLLNPIVKGLGARSNTVDYTGQYVSILLVGSLFTMGNYTFGQLLRSEGSVKHSIVGMILGTITNIILDPIFIFGLDMGVRGAALATVISQCCSCIWVISFLFGKRTTLRIRGKNMGLKAAYILPCLALGSAIFIMQGSESIISVCFNSSLLKYGGDIAVGAMTILTSVMQFAMLPLQGLGQGAQPIISYNYGAKNASRVRAAFKLLLKVSLLYSTILWLFIMCFPKVFASIFTTDAALIAFTKDALRYYLAVMFLFGIQIACQMTFNALGNAPASILVAIMRKFVLLIPLIFILPHIITSDKTMAVYLAEPIADVLAVTFTSILFSFQFKKALREMEEKQC